MASMCVSWNSLAIAVRTLRRGSLGQEWEFRARLRKIGMTLRSYWEGWLGLGGGTAKGSGFGNFLEGVVCMVLQENDYK